MSEKGVGGTPGVPYEEDVEYWVRFLKEGWQDDAIPQEVIDEIRAAPSMFKAREIAMAFHNKMLST